MTSILKVDTIQDADGNNIINESSNTITIGASGDTTNVIGTLNKDGIAVANTPAFEAYGSADQTGVADNTWTKINFNTERFDSDSMYDTSTYRFTPTVAGKYYIYSSMAMYSSSTNTLQIPNMAIYKNGSQYIYTPQNYNTTPPPNEVAINISATVDFNGSSDYVEIYARGNVTSSTVNFEITSATGNFGGYKIIGA
jgi:hypothetical protein